MKLAQIMAGRAAGGAESFFERLSAGLHAAGDEVLPLIRRQPARAERLRAAGLAPQEFAFGGALDVATRFRVGAALQKFAPRVAIAWMGRAAQNTPAGPWVLVGRLGGRYDLKRFRHCDHLVCNTPAIVDWCVGQKFAPERVHLLPNYVPDYAGATPAALPVPPGAKLVLGLGRLHAAKGFDVLIAALTRLPGVHAALAGEGPELPLLTKLAQQAGVADRVHFLGLRTDTAALLAAADILVCPSRSEPLGNVVLEAFSAGVPVVAAAADGPRGLIETGKNGVLVPVDSGIALASGIGALLGDPARAAAMGQAGRQVFESQFSEAAVLAQWRGFLAGVEKA